MTLVLKELISFFIMTLDNFFANIITFIIKMFSSRKSGLNKGINLAYTIYKYRNSCYKYPLNFIMTLLNEY